MATEDTAPTELPESTEPEGEEPEGEGGTDVAAAKDGGEELTERQKKRREWHNQRQQVERDLRAELDRERKARQQFEVQMAELRGRMEAQQQQPQEDPHEARIKDLMEKAERQLGDGATSKDPATAQAALRAYHATMREVSRLEAQQAVASERQQWSQQQMDPGTQAMAARLANEFSWLTNRAGARALADEYIEDMVTKEGHPRNYETFRAACARVASELKLGGTPTNGHANGNGQRYMVPAARNGAGGGEIDPPMKLTADEEKIAEHWGNRYHPNLSEEGVRKMWWNAIGKKARQASRAQ